MLFEDVSHSLLISVLNDRLAKSVTSFASSQSVLLVSALKFKLLGLQAKLLQTRSEETDEHFLIEVDVSSLGLSIEGEQLHMVFDIKI